MRVSPINALQNRTSAHFTEINSFYMHEMTKRVMEKHEEIASKRSSLSDEVKKTKYAREGYQYIAPHVNYREPVSSE